jgi:hypothetical protein
LKISLPGICLALVFQAVALGQTASTTSLTASSSPSNYGQPVTLTATVTSGATGKVTFYDGVTILGIGTISGTQASISTVMLPSGNRKLRAYYQGNGTYGASSSVSVPQSVVAGVSMGLRPPISFPAPFQSSGMAVADFNGDHKQDLALVDTYGNAVDIYLGNGDGTFPSAVAYPVGTAPGSVVIADFNGDGVADLAITTSGNSVDIFLGNGDGTFQPALNSVLSGILTALATGDFNGDGKADLVFADASNNLDVVLGNGDGTFGDTIFVSAGASTVSVAVADFNGDGRADLVITYQYPGNVGVLLGNGDGTFQNPITQSIAPSLTSVIVADFNGDGKPDMVAYAPSSNPQGGLGIIVLLGNGDGTFETAGRYFTGFFLGSVAVEDFNGDGIPDIAVTGTIVGNGSVAIMFGNGDGTFGNTEFYNAPFNLGPSTAGDFNGDGIPDLVMTGSNTACVLLGGAIVNPPVTIQTIPSGLQFKIDGGALQTAPQTVNLAPGNHTIAVSTQNGSPGTQYVFSSWSDGGLASHSITVSAPKTYTAISRRSIN